MKLNFDAALKEFGLSDEPEEPRPKYYKFESSITGKIVNIEILEDDIIIDGELRRIIRDEAGEIPEWVKPINSYNSDYVRVSPNGNYYTKSGKLGKLYNQKISIAYKGDAIGRTLRKVLVYTFIEYNREKFKVNFTHQDTEKFDITNVEYTLKEKIKPIKESISEIDRVGILKYGNMVSRCSEKFQANHKAYIGCSLSEEWKDRNNFIEWFRESVYLIKSIQGEISKLQVEKDILIKDNKIYGPGRCLLVPIYINNYFTQKDSKLGLPGVTETRLKNGGVKYTANIRDFLGEQNRLIGRFYTPEAAHREYLKEKNRQLQEVVIPYFIDDILPEYRKHPMVLKIIETLRRSKIV